MHYEIAVYSSREMAENAPQDWLFSFTKKDWYKMGGRVPRGECPFDVTLKIWQ
jgi:hypothetical protein